jgi:SAM-dependent methyltransferase
MMDLDVRSILDLPAVYALWQAPFVAQKIGPFLAAGPAARAGRVLELGCGPGTNAHLFNPQGYVGIDLSPNYVEAARRRHRGRFVCGDAAAFDLPDEPPFDRVFINSLLHHLRDEQVESLLIRAVAAVAAEGEIHVLDLTLPARPSVARFLARADRGGFARPLKTWAAMLGRHFDTVAIEPYAVRCVGVSCWEMFYFRGRRFTPALHDSPV